MLKSISLVNFQKYKKKTIQFGPNVNCIVGPSYAGKSTIFRALRWAATNKSNTKWNRRKKNWKAKSVSAKIVFDDTSVKRIKKTRENIYRVRNKEYKAFNTKVPPVVKKALRLDDVNFQKQLDGPYWFQLPASQVAKQLNEIVNLSIIDKVLTKANQLVRDGESEERVLIQQQTDLEKEIQDTKWIVKCRKEWKELRADRKAIHSVRQRRADLDALIAEYSTSGTSALETLVTEFEPIADLISQYEKIHRQRKRLNKLITEYEESNPSELIRMVKDFDKLDQFRKECNTFAETRRTLDMYLMDYHEASIEIEQWENRIVQWEAELKTLSKKRCKLCGQQLPNQNPSRLSSGMSMQPSKNQKQGMTTIGCRHKPITMMK